jgi:hypothetical protein
LAGVSLVPLAAPGDLLLVESAPAAVLGAGELVVAEADGALTAHRIVARRRRAGAWWLRTAGERALVADAWVPASAILGRVVGIEGKERGAPRRAAPAGWRARFWALRRRARCRIHRARKIVSG